MSISVTNNTLEVQNLELLAKQVVEGFITGIHKSPFHGFSVEFAEHRLYNNGESTRHIDWKTYAKTEKLFVKRYEEETNLRCHIMIDNSASMHFPILKKQRFNHWNKIGFSVVATAALSDILRRQRDALGLSIYSDQIDYYAPAKGTERHRRMLLSELENLLQKASTKSTNTHEVLHQLADKVHKRSLLFLFTDMLQNDKEEQELFEALRHLKHNQHEVVLFHVFDGNLELNFNFDERPKKFIDVETGESIDLFTKNIKNNYTDAMNGYFNRLKLKCLQYKIDYVPLDIRKDLNVVLSSYLIRRKSFL